jgi:hypothetical protein
MFKATAYLVDVPSGARIGKFYAYGPTPSIAGQVDIACSLEAGKQRAGVGCTDAELVFLPRGHCDDAEDGMRHAVLEDVFFKFAPPFAPM